MASSNQSKGELTPNFEPEIEQNQKTPGTGLEFEKLEGPIDEGYSWVICACAFVLNFCTWGMNSGFAIYLSHYLNFDTFQNMSKIDYGYIGGMSFGVGLFFSPFLNSLYSSMGIKPMIMLGNCIQFTALMLASFATNRWQIFCTQGLFQSFGLAVLSIPMMTILPQYFDKYRILAGGLATCGSGMGGLVFNLGMYKITQKVSVFWALRAQSIISFGMVCIATIFLKSKNKPGSTVGIFDSLDVYLKPDFWLMAAFVMTCILGYVILLYTMAAFTVSLGYNAYQGSIVSAMVQLGLLVGRPWVGLLSDKFGMVTTSFFCYLICGILSFAMWIPARNYATVIIFALFEGALMGCIYGMLSPTIQRIYGAENMVTIFSRLWLFVGVAGVFSPVIGIKLTKGNDSQVDPSSYLYCSIFAGSMFFGASVFLLLVRGHINAREHLIVEANKNNDADNAMSIHSDVKVTLLKILVSSVKPPIQRKFDRVIAVSQNENSEVVEEKIAEFKPAVI